MKTKHMNEMLEDKKIYEVHKMNTNFTRHEKNLKDIDTIKFLIQKKCTKNENWK